MSEETTRENTRSRYKGSIINPRISPKLSIAERPEDDEDLKCMKIISGCSRAQRSILRFPAFRIDNNLGASHGSRLEVPSW